MKMDSLTREVIYMILSTYLHCCIISTRVERVPCQNEISYFFIVKNYT